MIPLCIPNLAGKEAEYLAECVSSTFVSTVGPFVEKFEALTAEKSGAPYAVATCSGTCGLHAAYVASGVKRDDLVISPSLTFIATANAISHAGAQPWLFDVDPTSWTLDVTQLKIALSKETHRDADGDLIHTPTSRRVSAITPVFTLGMPADMSELTAIARDARLPLIADGAAAFGGSYNGKLTGNLGADLTMYSFNGNKIVTAGGGGAVVGANKKLLDHLRHLTTTARVGANYDHDMVGFNYRMTNLQAAVGCAQLEQLETFTTAKARIDRRYREAFSELPVEPFPIKEGRVSARWFTGFRIPGDDGSARAESLRASLRENGIDARPFWKPMHLQDPYRQVPCEPTPVSDDLWQQIVTLPCSTQLSDRDQAHVISSVEAWFQT